MKLFVFLFHDCFLVVFKLGCLRKSKKRANLHKIKSSPTATLYFFIYSYIIVQKMQFVNFRIL